MAGNTPLEAHGRRVKFDGGQRVPYQQTWTESGLTALDEGKLVELLIEEMGWITPGCTSCASRNIRLRVVDIGDDDYFADELACGDCGATYCTPAVEELTPIAEELIARRPYVDRRVQFLP